MIWIIAAPNFEGGCERHISEKVFDILDTKGTGIHWVSGDVSPLPVKKSPGSPFYDDRKYTEYILKLMQAPHWSVFAWWEKVSDGDVVVMCDFWTPGLDLIKYAITMGMKKEVKFAGYLHGASFVPGDMMEDCDDWIKTMEENLLSIYDQIWCASEFFSESIPHSQRYKARIIGEPFDANDYKEHRDVLGVKKYDVCFPHRVDYDKGPDDLIKIATMMPKHSFVIMGNSVANNLWVEQLKELPNVTMKMNVSDEEHLQILGGSRIVLSTAIQEGWGYGVMKAIACGCIPVLPNRAVYPELYDKIYLYDNIEEAAGLISNYAAFYPTRTFIPRTYNLENIKNCLEEIWIQD